MRTASRLADEARSFAVFLHHYPEFDAALLGELRDTEYGRLDAQDQVYLDYTGGGLFARVASSREHLALLRRTRARQPALRQPDLAGGD